MVTETKMLVTNAADNILFFSLNLTSSFLKQQIIFFLISPHLVHANVRVQNIFEPAHDL